ncbi:MAG: uncharacterized protein QOD72_3778 [Acidimicrobiaceae bacterium]|nr:uncharacterized protein [Acidimicrobiaceae bacterium]
MRRVIEILTPTEVRVLGCLMEKAVTTPDSYPLTVNALTAACNQTTNRYPVVHFGEPEVTAALTSLRERSLTRIVYSPSNRAPKHRHVIDEAWRLTPDEVAVLCVLFLRGPQTEGELKGRTERMHAFADLGEVEATLDRLAARDEPLTVRLPRQPGQKDARYAHLVAGEPDVSFEATAGSTGGGRSLADRVAALEADVAKLRETIEELLG